MEKLFLGTVLAGKKLDVIDQQRIHLLEAALELVHRFFNQRLGHGTEELFGTQVEHPCAGIVSAQFIARSEHQVRLAQSGSPVQQQRIVGPVTRLLRRLPSGGAAQLVASSFDEVVKGVMRIQIASVGFVACLLYTSRCV